MYTGKTDIASWFIYIFVAILCSILVNKAVVVESQVKNGKNKKNTWFGLLWGLLLVLAVFRKVDYNIGGSDALHYAAIFEKKRSLDVIKEPLFVWFTKLLQLFSDDYHLYFAVIYSIIVLGYILVIKEYAELSNNCIPYLLLLFP